MIKYLLILILLIQCSTILGEDDHQIDLKAEHLTGEWINVTEAPSEIRGLYRKDTVIYQIGLEKLTDYVKFVDKSIYDPLTFKIIYPKGGNVVGYLEKPNDFDYRDFDYDRGEAILNYKLYLGLPGVTTKDTISFSVPQGFPADTLRVTINHKEIFGLKKRKGR